MPFLFSGIVDITSLNLFLNLSFDNIGTASSSKNIKYGQSFEYEPLLHNNFPADTYKVITA